MGCTVLRESKLLKSLNGFHLLLGNSDSVLIGTPVGATGTASSWHSTVGSASTTGSGDSLHDQLHEADWVGLNLLIDVWLLLTHHFHELVIEVGVREYTLTDGLKLGTSSQTGKLVGRRVNTTFFITVVFNHRCRVQASGHAAGTGSTHARGDAS